MNRTIFTLVLSAAAALSSTSSHAQVEYCDWRMRSVCESGCYVFVAPSTDNSCDSVNALVIDHAPADQPPPDPQLKCERNTTGYSCTAWPQGDNLSYAWSASDNSAADAYPTADATREFDCNAKDVSVTVVSPAGASAETSVSLPGCN
ncbi:hypothetical protein [Tahibacter caeni]|uniref:hypothetical protein n=1 Tax=Tahibacter caeni TaxID=1453545 RepID=UPI0021472559|nr:hypothetical protein [Tahibacter caeni]